MVIKLGCSNVLESYFAVIIALLNGPMVDYFDSIGFFYYSIFLLINVNIFLAAEVTGPFDD